MDEAAIDPLKFGAADDTTQEIAKEGREFFLDSLIILSKRVNLWFSVWCI